MLPLNNYLKKMFLPKHLNTVNTIISFSLPGDMNMCMYELNGICLDPEKNEKGIIGIRCYGCHKKDFCEEPDPEIEYIHPVFR